MAKKHTKKKQLERDETSTISPTDGYNQYESNVRRRLTKCGAWRCVMWKSKLEQQDGQGGEREEEVREPAEGN